MACITDLGLRKNFPSHFFFLPSLSYEQLFFFYASWLHYSVCAFSAMKCFSSVLCCCFLF